MAILPPPRAVAAAGCPPTTEGRALSRFRFPYRFLAVLAALVVALPLSAATWERNTFPGPGHKANPTLFPVGQGQDRGQWCTYFGVSPLDGNFQLFCMNTEGGSTVYSKDGKSFRPVDVPMACFAQSGAFSPHDANTAFLLYATAPTATFLPASTTPTTLNCLQSGHPYGLWRTTDQGETWQQIYEVPQGSYYPQVNGIGKTAVAVDPYSGRSNHIYFGSFTDGLLRSTNNGSTWQTVAFANRLVSTVVASHSGANTKLYAIVGPKMPRHVDGIAPDYLKAPPASSDTADTDPYPGWAYWPLDAKTTDTSGNLYALTLMNFPSPASNAYVDGRIGTKSLSFDGVDDYAAIAGLNYAGNAYDKMSVGAWVRTTATGTTRVIASYGFSHYWQLELHSTGKVRYVVRGTGSASAEYFLGNTVITDGKWHHVAATFDAGQVKVYIDGFRETLAADALAASVTTFGTGTTRYGFLGAPSNADSFNGSLGAAAKFEGELDDVRIYTIALTETEVRRCALALWNGQNRFNEGELWRLDVNSGGTITNVVQLFGVDQDIVDVEVDPTDPTKGYVIKDGKPTAGKGGKELYRFTNSGTSVTDLSAGANPSYLDTDGYTVTDDLNYVFINPNDVSHVVVTTNGTLAGGAVRYSLNGGTTWLGINDHTLNTITVEGDPVTLSPDFKSYAPLIHQYYDAFAQDGSLHADETVRNQGANIGFKHGEPGTLYWWSTINAKTAWKSTDRGQTFMPYAYGSSTKKMQQLSVSAAGLRRITSFDEYGFAATEDSGKSWRGSNDENDTALSELWDQSYIEYPNEADFLHRMGWGVGLKPSYPLIAIGLYSCAPYIVRTTDGGLTWNKVINAATDKNYTTTTKGVVFWHRQNTSTVYAADMKSTDNGLTWSGMTTSDGKPVYILALSTENGDVLLGQTLTVGLWPESVSSPDWNLLASKDGGATWVPLPRPAQETVAGTSSDYWVVQLIGGFFEDPNPSCVAIDPSTDKDPTVPSQKLRVLLPGRQGIYEYNATDGNNLTGGSWTIRNTGITASEAYNAANSNERWMGRVVFDHSKPWIVYAAKTQDNKQLGLWAKTVGNTNQRYVGGQPYQPFYKSMDGGITWQNLHNEAVYGEVPQYHYAFGSMVVDDNGVLYTSSATGMYILK